MTCFLLNTVLLTAVLSSGVMWLAEETEATVLVACFNSELHSSTTHSSINLRKNIYCMSFVVIYEQHVCVCVCVLHIGEMIGNGVGGEVYLTA